MKLYKILLRHCGPKSCEEFIRDYVIALNDEQVMKGIDEEYLFHMWSERNDEDGLFEIYDDQHSYLGQETYFERLLRFKGEFNDPNASYDDGYYGIHHYGWSEGVEISVEQLANFKQFVKVKNWINRK